MDVIAKILVFLMLKGGFGHGDMVMRASDQAVIENLRPSKIIIHIPDGNMVDRLINECNNIQWIDYRIVEQKPGETTLARIELSFNFLSKQKLDAIMALLRNYQEIISVETRNEL